MRMNSDLDQGFKNAIWTDGETCRDLIWRSYIGFKENLENYIMYLKSFGVHHKVFAGGLWRYSISLYEEIKPFISLFNNNQSLQEQDSKVQEILDNNLLFKDNNFIFVTRFFNLFLFVSGMKNIIYTKDSRNGILKVTQDFYKIKK